jgi:formylmethanofuran dehydrogenase subunit D
MNERIKELKDQCWVEKRWDNGMWIEKHIDQEKFAELIVRECAQVCLSQRDPANLNYKPSERFAEAVTQHFGVREV